SQAEEVRMARADWQTGFVQAAIVGHLLEELGYEITDPAEATLSPETFYPLLARGEYDLWVNGWFPLHEPFLERELVTGQRAAAPVEPVGTLVEAGAVQGYLVDAATAAELEITSMEDFRRPEVAAAFDVDGDSRADLHGCEEGWGCRVEIDRQLAELAWGETVTQIVGDYDAHVAEARERVEAGEPVLLYAWTPSATVDVLRPGEDVVWVESPALPDAPEPTEVADLEGCAGQDPCELGWTVNDLRAVARTDLLEEHPAIRRLLEVVEIPAADLAAASAELAEDDEPTDDDVAAAAAAWISENRNLADSWVAHARDG
ncbi:MAG: glycine betaine/L-proline ABC transporter substrate-binding protein ProX, partial [Actinomycetota bacterium]